MHIRSDGRDERLRNARAALIALTHQEVPRTQYRIILVEQGSHSSACEPLRSFVDECVFAVNEGPYNRSWALNIGACKAGPGLLCFLDADMVVSRDFLTRCQDAFCRGARAIVPQQILLYLDRQSTELAANSLEQTNKVGPGRQSGELFWGSCGGCICVEAELYRQVGGHDERFYGWGREDMDFWIRLSRVTQIEQLPGVLLHLDHSRPDKNDDAAMHCRQLWAKIQKGEDGPRSALIGDPLRYARECEKITG